MRSGLLYSVLMLAAVILFPVKGFADNRPSLEILPSVKSDNECYFLGKVSGSDAAGADPEMSDLIAEDGLYKTDVFRQSSFSPSTGGLRGLELFVLSGVLLFIVFIVHFILFIRLKLRFQILQKENIMLRKVIDTLPVGVSWQFAGHEEAECNRIWAKYSDESGEHNTDNDYTIRNLSVTGQDDSADGLVRIAEYEREHQDAVSRCNSLVSELSFCKVEIERLKITDVRTGLFNYDYLESRVDEELERYRLYGQKFCLLSIELKKRCVEDLLSLAESIRSGLRRSDIIGYNGNGVFITVLPKTRLSEAEELLKKVLTGKLDGENFCGSVYELPAEEEELIPSVIRELYR